MAALEMKTSPLIRMAAPLTVADRPAALTARIKEDGGNQHRPRLRQHPGAAAQAAWRAGAGRTFRPPDAGDAAAALLEAVRSDPARRSWTEGARNLQARLKLMHGLEAELWPAADDESLIASLEDWLGPHLHGLDAAWRCGEPGSERHPAGPAGLVLESRLDKELPTHLPLPGGQAAVDYTQPVPIAAARAQHFYGLAETPKLAGGRVPLRLALLPACRPRRLR